LLPFSAKLILAIEEEGEDDKEQIEKTKKLNTEQLYLSINMAIT
jgi:hypothetical protein